MKSQINRTLIKAIIASVGFILTIRTAEAQKFWLTTYSFPFGPKTAITLVNDSCLFVGTTDKILRSCDDGFSWDITLTAPAVFSLITTQNGRLLAGGSGKIYYSDNLGNLWDSVSLNHTYPVTKIIQNVTGEIYAITGTLDNNLGFVGAGVFYSVTNGSEWTQRNNGLGGYLCCEQITHDSNGRLFLALADEYVSGNSGLFFSDNQGQQWQQVLIDIDGKNIIDNRIKVGNTRGLSVSPYDSVYLSISGTSVNAGVTLNLHKSTHDITNTMKWSITTVSNTATWWNDRLLNNIHFSAAGDWYSSMNGSINTGGTFFSKNNGISWNKHIEGLGFDQFGSFSYQYFAENDSGKIFMVQLLDERVYWADNSVFTSIPRGVEPENYPVSLFPNPVIHNNVVWLKSVEKNQYNTITITNILGKVIFRRTFSGTFYFYAPETRGVYQVTLKQGNGKNHIQRLIVN